jgi:hypothetical protein
MSFVLGRNSDPPDPRIQGVRKREVDDARLTTEIDGWLGAAVR